CRVTDLAERFGVSHVTVSRIVSRLQQEDLLDTEPYRPITLTAKGRRLAMQSRERHEIVFKFLRAIGVDETTAAIDAEGIEHHVSPGTLQRLKDLTDSGLLSNGGQRNNRQPFPESTHTQSSDLA
ncbi:MAG: helix-turn-helix domain-containing protein, partial [Planctomycetaceae bacterium]|nr:helix-turn-helix domain-containing protein [Planctomycetaceae bacterium]